MPSIPDHINGVKIEFADSRKNIRHPFLSLNKNIQGMRIYKTPTSSLRKYEDNILDTHFFP